MYAPGCSVVCVNYKTADDLREFGESFLVQDHPSSLVVVNVCPEPADVEVAEWLIGACEGPAKYVEFDENVGYAAAINYGASLTNHEIIVAFNADIVLRPAALKECSERLLSDDSWGILGPLQLDEQGRITHSGIFGSPAHPSFEGNWHRMPEDRHRTLRSNAIGVSGSAYFVKRSVWEEMLACPVYKRKFPDVIGAFGPTKFYYEETLLSYHAAAHGYSVVYDGTVEIVHKWHESVKQNGMEAWAAKQYDESRSIFRDFCAAHNIECE